MCTSYIVVQAMLPARKKREPKRGKGILDRMINFFGNTKHNKLRSGEKHGLLRVPGVSGLVPAQFLGPGTHVRDRIREGQRGLTYADRISRAHDVRASVGRSQADINRSDDIMLKAIAKGKREKLDSAWNLNQASLIGIRRIASKFGLNFGSSFGEKNLTNQDRQRYNNVLADARANGFGKITERPLRKKKQTHTFTTQVERSVPPRSLKY